MIKLKVNTQSQPIQLDIFQNETGNSIKHKRADRTLFYQDWMRVYWKNVAIGKDDPLVHIAKREKRKVIFQYLDEISQRPFFRFGRTSTVESFTIRSGK